MRAVADYLASLSSRRLVLLGAGCLALAGGVIAALEPRGARPFKTLLALLIAVGLVSLGLALVRWARALGARRPALLRLWLLGGALALAMAGFCTYSLGFYWKETNDFCGMAHYADTVEERRAQLAEGQRRLSSVFSILPELVGFKVSATCAMAARDIDRMDRGLCPYHMTTETPCACGEDRWPPPRPCEAPQCVIGGDPERLRCHGDPW